MHASTASPRVVRDDNVGLFWKAADGAGEAEPLLGSTGRLWPSGWTTDGRIILSTASGDIGVLAVEGERTLEMLLETPFEETSPGGDRVFPSGLIVVQNWHQELLERVPIP